MTQHKESTQMELYYFPWAAMVGKKPSIDQQLETSPEGKSSFLYITAHDDISVWDEKPVKVVLNGVQQAEWTRWSNT